MYDMVIRNGTVIDGSGSQGQVADIGISAGRIAAVGDDIGPGKKEIDAQGLLVTPGWVDIHTHYDGQVSWDPLLTPSSWNGVTTVVMGNCGVGFAPCREQDREFTVALMEGVEDIPSAVLWKGLPWGWETYGEYRSVVERRPFDMNVAGLLPHSCLRVCRYS